MREYVSEPMLAERSSTTMRVGVVRQRDDRLRVRAAHARRSPRRRAPRPRAARSAARTSSVRRAAGAKRGSVGERDRAHRPSTSRPTRSASVASSSGAGRRLRPREVAGRAGEAAVPALEDPGEQADGAPPVSGGRDSASRTSASARSSALRRVGAVRAPSHDDVTCHDGEADACRGEHDSEDVEQRARACPARSGRSPAASTCRARNGGRAARRVARRSTRLPTVEHAASAAAARATPPPRRGASTAAAGRRSAFAPVRAMQPSDEADGGERIRDRPPAGRDSCV